MAASAADPLAEANKQYANSGINPARKTAGEDSNTQASEKWQANVLKIPTQALTG